MDFSIALVWLKDGARIAREGWNGKGMFLFLMPGYPDGVEANEATRKGLGVAGPCSVVVRPYVMMKTAQDDIVPWVASQSDLLAEDWQKLP